MELFVCAGFINNASRFTCFVFKKRFVHVFPMMLCSQTLFSPTELYSKLEETRAFLINMSGCILGRNLMSYIIHISDFIPKHMEELIFLWLLTVLYNDMKSTVNIHGGINWYINISPVVFPFRVATM